MNVAFKCSIIILVSSFSSISCIFSVYRNNQKSSWKAFHLNKYSKLLSEKLEKVLCRLSIIDLEGPSINILPNLRGNQIAPRRNARVLVRFSSSASCQSLVILAVSACANLKVIFNRYAGAWQPFFYEYKVMISNSALKCIRMILSMALITRSHRLPYLQRFSCIRSLYLSKHLESMLPYIAQWHSIANFFKLFNSC